MNHVPIAGGDKGHLINGEVLADNVKAGACSGSACGNNGGAGFASQKLGGGSFDLIGDTIERQFQNAVTYHTGAAISLVMMILILISLAIMNKFSDNEEEMIV